MATVDNAVIERAKQELEAMVDLNPQVMLLVDRDCVVKRANRALLELIGASGFDAVLNRHLSDLFPVMEKDFFPRALDCGEGYGYNRAKCDLPAGPGRDLKFTIVEAGKMGSMLAVLVEDVTHETAREHGREKKHKMTAVQEVAGALMHVINQPLTVILMRAQLVQLALERGTISMDDAKSSLKDIMRLTSEIADTLRKVERSNDYITEPYTNTIAIMDIEKSAQDVDLDRDFDLRSRTLLAVLELQEPGARVHAYRASRLAGMMAQKLGLGEETGRMVRKGALLHDVGKVAITGEIVQKSDGLDDDEMNIMREHAEKGRDILVACLLAEEAEVAYSHHEHYDGKGYPAGLAGDEIPMAARITAVADAFDVLHFGRPYQKAVSIGKALAEIGKSSGTQFDPEVVSALEAVEKELPKV